LRSGTLSALVCIQICAGPTPAQAQTIAGCPVFPATNVWNTPIDGLPVSPSSAVWVATIGADKPLVTDFGSGTYQGEPIGIPFVVVPGSQPKVPISFQYADESDPGPYPIPPDAPIEGGSQSTGDRHVLVVDRDNCVLYEVYSAYPQSDGSWQAGSGAIFPLNSNKLRPQNWTSADAAGLPVLPGLARYDEAAAGEIRHAIRFTAPETQRAYIWPARHFASALTGSRYPPMGARFRLKASVDISGFSPEDQVILRALKKYGMLLADNGSSWYISGAPDDHWNNDNLHNLRNLHGSDFEAVDESSLVVDPNSGEVRHNKLLNAASFAEEAVAAGEIFTIFGSNIGPATPASSAPGADGLIPKQLSGVIVSFDGTRAPLLYVSSMQMNAIVPFAVAGQSSTHVVVTYNGNVVWDASLAVNKAAPGLFTANSSGTGQAAALNQDFGINSGTNPAGKGSIVMLFATGAGQTDPAGVDGKITQSDLPKPKLPVSVSIGGQSADVLYAGNAPGLVAGALQVNARIPQNVSSGAASVVLTIGGVESQSGVTLAVR
jgi:uncharacterized protein (TIGR03437 family)